MMTIQEKRKAKKYSLLFFILSYIFMGVLAFGAIIYVVITIKNDGEFNQYVLFSLLFGPIIIGFPLSMVGQLHLNKRLTHRANIRAYRRRLMFVRFIDYFLNREYSKAVDAYNAINNKDEHLLGFLNGLLIGFFLADDDAYEKEKKYREQAITRLNELRDSLDPEKIEF